MPDEIERADIEALGAARAELGPTYERELLDSFAEKVEATIERRVRAGSPARTEPDRLRTVFQFIVAMTSVGAAIPISIVLRDDLVSLLVTLGALVLINGAIAEGGRRK